MGCVHGAEAGLLCVVHEGNPPTFPCGRKQRPAGGGARRSEKTEVYTVGVRRKNEFTLAGWLCVWMAFCWLLASGKAWFPTSRKAWFLSYREAWLQLSGSMDSELPQLEFRWRLCAAGGG